MNVFELEYFSQDEPTRIIKLGHEGYTEEEVLDLFGEVLIRAREGNAKRVPTQPEEYQWWEFKFAADYLVKHLGFVLLEESE